MAGEKQSTSSGFVKSTVEFTESTSGTSSFSCGQSSSRNGSLQYDSIQESNIGFQLLKKAGWKEGTGLGVAEQGQLNPVETYLKFDKRGIGAEKKVKPTQQQQEQKQMKPKVKKISKAAKRAAEEEARYQEQEFRRAFFREFWPENV